MCKGGERPSCITSPAHDASRALHTVSEVAWIGPRVERRALANALLLAQGFGDLLPVDLGESVAHDPRAVARLAGVCCSSS